MIFLLTVVFALHFAGDFLLQRPFLALTKSYWPVALLEHVMIYKLVLFSGVFLLFPGSAEDKLDFVFVNAFIHFLTDYFTGPLFKRVEASRGLHNSSVPFLNTGAVTIYGLDQLIHFWVLTATTIFYFN